MEPGEKHMEPGDQNGNSGLMTTADHPPDKIESPRSKWTPWISEGLVWLTLALLLAFSIATFIYPAGRVFYRVTFNFNEGWNVYNTQAAMQHRALYPAKHTWTDVNYPFLSFYLVGYLAHFSGDYLVTGRVVSLVSLLVSCVLVGLIVKRLSGRWGPSVFASVFCLGLFCGRALNSVGADDPQMLAHPFFLFGLWLYMQEVPGTLRLGGIASIFILGGNIKHNLLPAPLAVLFDLFTTSPRKAVQFMAWGVILLALSIAVNIGVGGPFFLAQMLSPRAYSLSKLGFYFYLFFAPLALPITIAVFWSIWQFSNPKARVISLYFFSSLLVGVAFAGGVGVADNTWFDCYFAISIIAGACLDALWEAPIANLGKGAWGRFLVPLLLYSCSFLIFLPRGLHPSQWLSELTERQRVYKIEVSFLADQPGPALCETLIMCYDAGKPDVLHPFGFTAGVRTGQLKSDELVQQIAAKKYGAIQTEAPVTRKPSERFPNEVLDAIAQNYVETVNRGDCHIYLPRTESGNAAPPQ